MRAHLLLSLGLFFPLAGCGDDPVQAVAEPAQAVAGQEPAPGPAAQPDGAAEYAWLNESPMRDLMRAMWVDCGVILSVAAPGGTQIDHERVECAAEDIARKADRMAALWQACVDSTDDCAEQARAGEWDLAWQHHGRLWKRCCDCHVETWSGVRRGVSPSAIEGWSEGKAAKLHTLPEGALQTPEGGPADPPVREQMTALLNATNAMREALDAESSEQLAKTALASRALMKAEIATWRALAESARKMQKLAQGRASEDGRKIYNEMTMQCVICHSRTVTTPREFLTPPPW